MVVDDEPAMVRMIKIELEANKYNVVTAHSGEEGLEKTVSEKPDLIVMDNIMGDMKGSEIARALKSNDLTKQIPIIIVSGKGEMIYNEKLQKFEWRPNNPNVKERGELPEAKSPEALADAFGVENYLPKPFDGQELIALIEETLNKKKEEDIVMQDPAHDPGHGFADERRRCGRVVLDSFKEIPSRGKSS